MSKIDRSMFGLMCLLSAAFALAAVRTVFLHKQADKVAMASQFIPFQSTEVISPGRSYAGNPRSSYTLVEFGDYQCPPCREVSKKVPQVLNRYSGKVCFQFRNLPLVRVHPYAQPAAIAAEAAREQGQFWPAHDLLYRNELTPQSIRSLSNMKALNRERFSADCKGTARAAVAADTKEAARLGLHMTPTFLLCCPGGRVARLESLDQLDDFVN